MQSWIKKISKEKISLKTCNFNKIFNTCRNFPGIFWIFSNISLNAVAVYPGTKFSSGSRVQNIYENSLEIVLTVFQSPIVTSSPLHPIIVSIQHHLCSIAPSFHQLCIIPSKLPFNITVVSSPHCYIHITSFHHSLHSTRRPKAQKVIFVHQIRLRQFDQSCGHPNTISIDKNFFFNIFERSFACTEREN